LFLDTKNPVAARRAAEAIRQRFRLVAENPSIGRPYPSIDGARELVIPFGDAGYLALYRHFGDRNIVLIMAFRHQSEAGY